MTPQPYSSHSPTPSSNSSSNQPHLPSLLLKQSLLHSTLSTTSLSNNGSTSSSNSNSRSNSKSGLNRLRRVISSASLSAPSIVLDHHSSISESTTPTTSISKKKGKEKEVIDSSSDEGEEDGGSVSSGFEGLLDRVNGGSSDERARNEKARNVSGSSSHMIEDLNLSIHSSRVLEEEEEEADIDVELIGKEEGQIDPRDMLREQLRKTKSRGNGRTRASLTGNTGNFEDRSDEALPSANSSLYSPRRYFILSSAGKLIFTTDADEDAAIGYVSVMQAIISIFADEGDKLRYVDAGSTKIAIMLKPPLYLVCVSDWAEPESVLRTHMEYLYLQVLSVVTYSQLQAIFAKRSNFDLRRLLEGTEPFFKNLTENLQSSLPILTSSLEVYRMDNSLRDEVAKALAPASKIPELLYALLLSPPTSSTSSSTTPHSTTLPPKIITLLRPKSHSIHPTDLHLLLNTISSSSSLFSEGGGMESWIPICLPRFEKSGFLHVWICFTGNGTGAGAGVGVVLVGGDRDSFEKMRECGRGVIERLKGKGLLERIEKGRFGEKYSLAELAIPGLRHFLYKSKKFVQATFPEYEGDYEEDVNKFRLISLYQKLHESLHSSIPSSGGATRPPASLVYLRTEHEAVLGWSTATFELYLAVSPLLPKTAVVSAARAVSKWVKAEEGKLFLVSAPSF